MGSPCARDAEVSDPTARFKYDAQGRRIARWVAATGQWTYFVFGPSGELLSELAFTNDPSQPWMPLRDYVWLDGRPLAQLEYAPSLAAPRPYYFHLDHIGMPRALSSPEGATVWSAATKPYGEVSETMTPDPVTGRTIVTNLRLPGQYDERLFAAAGISGMQGPYYNWNRWYLPSVGRYLELDPLALKGEMNGFGMPDWYNYGLGNPLIYTDPKGENPGVGAAIGLPICGPPCAILGGLAGLGAAIVLGKIGSDVIDQCKKPKSGYECTAKCQANGSWGGAYYVEKTSPQDCASAIKMVKDAIPLGEYPRHCSCRDSNGFRGVGHQCEAHHR